MAGKVHQRVFPIAEPPQGARFIGLTHSKIALVDEEDYAELARFNWCAMVSAGLWYAKRAALVDGKHKTILMHRALTGAPPFMRVDHKNGNGLDNRRTNLRIVTSPQNGQNMRSSPNQKRGGFKGVSRAPHGRWQVHIRIPNPAGGVGKRMYLGQFKSAEAAAREYDQAALTHHGEFAALNFPPRQT